jgi:hypothetical protein
MTWWFVLPRFGSCKPTPRWGGHKDRVSFNHFPLSNGHLDRVSFSSQSIGTLSPHKDHHTISVSYLDYNWVGNKKEGRRKAIQVQELKWTQLSLSLVTIWLEWSLDLGDVWSLVCVLEWSLELLYEIWWLKTWMHWSVVVEGIYTQPPKGLLVRASVVWRTGHPVRHRTLSGAPATSLGRWVLIVGASDMWATWQSGGAPDRSCSLSGHIF